MRKRPYRNGEIWDFEAEMKLNNNGSDLGQQAVILGLDGGTTSTVCVCMPFNYTCTGSNFNSEDGHLPEPPSVLARAVAGCSNHNSVGGNKTNFPFLRKILSSSLSSFFFFLLLPWMVYCIGTEPL